MYDYYNRHGRHDLLWRHLPAGGPDPYAIAVSEIMLQQTQVARVREKYEAFLTAFPNVQILARAPLLDVLTVWAGLGYNRRAKFLKTMAEKVVAFHGGIMPKTVAELQALPGIGEYTARAIATFAYNQPHALIETNIRTVFMHHFFSRTEDVVSDTVLMALIEKTLDRDNPRTWYWALMDYGSALKAQGIKIHRKSAQYKKQKPLKGSVREVRGAIIKVLTMRIHTDKELRAIVPHDAIRYKTALDQLMNEMLVIKKGGRYRIAP